MTNQPVHKSILGNGIRVVSKSIPHIQTISMVVWINVGARDLIGLPHLMERKDFNGKRSRIACQNPTEPDATRQAKAMTSLLIIVRFYSYLLRQNY